MATITYRVRIVTFGVPTITFRVRSSTSLEAQGQTITFWVLAASKAGAGNSKPALDAAPTVESALPRSAGRVRADANYNFLGARIRKTSIPFNEIRPLKGAYSLRLPERPGEL